MNNKQVLLILICGIVGAILGYVIIGLPYMNQRIEQEYNLKFTPNNSSTFSSDPEIDPNETEYEECIRVWNDTIGLELLKDSNETLQVKCDQYK